MTHGKAWMKLLTNQHQNDYLMRVPCKLLPDCGKKGLPGFPTTLVFQASDLKEKGKSHQLRKLKFSDNVVWMIDDQKDNLTTLGLQHKIQLIEQRLREIKLDQHLEVQFHMTTGTFLNVNA